MLNRREVESSYGEILMDATAARQPTITRQAAAEMTAQEFRAVGHRLVDEIAAFLESIPQRPVIPAVSPEGVRRLLPSGGQANQGLPERGTPAGKLLEEAARL